MKTYGIAEVQPHLFSSALDENQWSDSHTIHFVTGDRHDDTNLIGSRVGPTAGSEILATDWSLNIFPRSSSP
jgi:hypothetical protein